MSLPLNFEQNYELGRLFYDRVDYTKALNNLTKAADQAYESGEYERYIDITNYVLRILVEKEDHPQIQKIKEKIQDLSVKRGVEISSRTHYILGLCTYYKDGHESIAMDYFQKALKIALSNDNKVDMCYAIYGIANTYYSQGNLDEALKELYNLDVFFGALQVPDLQISSRLLNGLIHRNRGEYDKAIECFWQAYEMLKLNTNMLLYFNALYGLGSTYLRLGDRNMSRVYLQLAMRSINEAELPRMTKLLKATINELGQEDADIQYDLIFNSESNTIVEKNLGKVDFKNQFILIDLLQLLARTPGKTFSKEVLVKKVWDQNYDPTVHDNKIYVTIKRLRQLIEPDLKKPKYIFRGKNGYYLNRSARVLLG